MSWQVKHNTVSHNLRRRGTTLTELLVAIGLISSILTVGVPMSLKIARLRQVYRQRLTVVEELSSQMETLSTLSIQELRELKPPLPLPDSITSQLTDASLHLELNETEGATRLRLAMEWTDRLGNRSEPVGVSYWIFEGQAQP